jgi:hypothetical protein
VIDEKGQFPEIGSATRGMAGMQGFTTALVREIASKA